MDTDVFNIETMGVRTLEGSDPGVRWFFHPENRSQRRECVGAADRRSLTAGFPPTLHHSNVQTRWIFQRVFLYVILFDRCINQEDL